jgi:hypothetical protein
MINSLKDYRTISERDMEFLMIYKISPDPSLLKRGRKTRNAPFDNAKSIYIIG